ncbi:hypothetical protein KKE06_03875 [Candidatus Micrarchaeota archaeon]|nr:hypothetical protein [Candidatus Micrarchaeota archaeon]
MALFLFGCTELGTNLLENTQVPDHYIAQYQSEGGRRGFSERSVYFEVVNEQVVWFDANYSVGDWQQFWVCNRKFDASMALDECTCQKDGQSVTPEEKQVVVECLEQQKDAAGEFPTLIELIATIKQSGKSFSPSNGCYQSQIQSPAQTTTICLDNEILTKYTYHWHDMGATTDTTWELVQIH